MRFVSTLSIFLLVAGLSLARHVEFFADGDSSGRSVNDGKDTEVPQSLSTPYGSLKASDIWTLIVTELSFMILILGQPVFRFGDAIRRTMEGGNIFHEFAIVGLDKLLNMEQVKDFITESPVEERERLESFAAKIKVRAAQSKYILGEIANYLEEEYKLMIQTYKIGFEKIGEIVRNAIRKSIDNPQETKKLIREKLLTILQSDLFRDIVATLPNSVQDFVNKLLKKLEGGTNTEFYGISDILTRIKTDLPLIGLGVIESIKNLWDDINKKVGTARDVAILKLEALLEKIASKIPTSLKERFLAFTTKIKSMAEEARSRLLKIKNDIQEKTQSIIDSLKDNVENSRITAKLREAQQLLNQKSQEAKELGRQKMLEVLNSEAFLRVAAKLPQVVQDKIDELRKSLEEIAPDA